MPPVETAHRNRSRRRWVWPTLAIVLAVAPVFFWGGGLIEEEALSFLRNFWGDRPVLQRIFETREFDDYQGRELSYAIDCLDAQWVRLLLSRGIFVLVSPSVVASSLAFVAIGLWLVPAALPRLERRTGWLVLLLYLSNFAVVSTTGLLYRATKPLVAPLLLALVLLALAEHRKPRLGPATASAAALAMALVASLLDRQGLFYVLVILLVLAAAWLRTRRGLGLALGTAAAVGAWLVYDYAVGPWLIHRLNGYWPDMSFQRVSPQWLLSAGPWIEAVRLLGGWTQVLFGGLPPALIAAVGAGVGCVRAWRERGRPLRLAVAAAIVLAAIVGQLAMVAVMVVRHRAVTWIDHRFWYYPMPFQVLIGFGLLWALERATRSAGGRLPRAVPFALGALVIANVAEWPEHRMIMQSGPWFSDVARRSALLVRSLRSGQQAPLLDGEYRRFHFECLQLFPRLGERTGDYVAEGKGIGLAEIQRARVVAWVRRQAHLTVWTKAAGRFVIAGSVRLDPDESLEVQLDERPLGAALHGGGPGQAPSRFRIATELPAGRSELQLVARPRRLNEGGRRRPPQGFVLFLPVTVSREAGAARTTTIF